MTTGTREGAGQGEEQPRGRGPWPQGSDRCQRGVDWAPSSLGGVNTHAHARTHAPARKALPGSSVAGFFASGCTRSMWKFLGQGWNLSRPCANTRPFNPLRGAGIDTQSFSLALAHTQAMIPHNFGGVLACEPAELLTSYILEEEEVPTWLSGLRIPGWGTYTCHGCGQIRT